MLLHQAAGTAVSHLPTAAGAASASTSGMCVSATASAAVTTTAPIVTVQYQAGRGALNRALRRVPVFASLDEHELQWLASQFKRRAYAVGDVVHTPTSRQQLLVVVSGRLMAAVLPPVAAPAVAAPATAAGGAAAPSTSSCHGWLRVRTSSAWSSCDAISTSCLATDGAQVLLAAADSFCLAVSERRLQKIVHTLAACRALQTAATKLAVPLDATIAKLRSRVHDADSKAGLCAALRRYSDQLHDLPLPSSRKRTYHEVRFNVDQARKDLLREHSVMLNGVKYALGSVQQLDAFICALAAAVEQGLRSSAAFASGAGAAPATITDGSADSVEAVQDRHHLAAVTRSVMCDVLIACCRTMTGGDSYAMAHSLFFNPSLALLTAETAVQAPSIIVVQGSAVFIESVNSYRICSMMGDGPSGPSTGDDAGSGGFGGADADASGSGGVDVWAWLRCRSREFVSYSPASAGATPASSPGGSDAGSAAAAVDGPGAQASSPDADAVPRMSLGAFVGSRSGATDGVASAAAADGGAVAPVAGVDEPPPLPSVHDESFAAVLAAAATSTATRVQAVVVRTMDVKVHLTQ